MKRILVIDDDVQMREMLRQMLEREGYNVRDASDGKVAMRLFAEEPADLVITDIIMPEKEGIEVIREFRRDFPEVKIIAISGGGYVGPQTYLKIAKGMGAMRTFAKPVGRGELLDAVHDLI